MDEIKNEMTEVVEEAAEATKENFFKRALACAKNALKTIKEFFVKVWNSEIVTKIKSGFAKIPAWFRMMASKIFKTNSAEEGLGTLKNTGVLGNAAKKSTKLADKFCSKIEAWFEDHKFFRILAKILGGLFLGAFAIGVIYYIILLLPTILAACAEILAVALIVRVVFGIIEFVTKKNEVEDEEELVDED